MYLPEKGYKRILVIVLYIIIASVFFYFLFNRLLGYILPFIIGWFIAMIIQRPVKFLKAKLKIPKKISSFVLVMLIVTVALSALIFSVSGIISEIESFSSYLSENAEKISEKINSFLSSLPEKLGFITKFFDRRQISERINGEISNYLTQLLGSAISKLPTLAANIASFMPKVLIFNVILIISAFYLSWDFHNINSFILDQFGDKTKNFIKEFKSLFINVIGKLLRAYLMIALITFTELYLGLTVIGVKYSFTISLITCIIDILPIFGSGLVLVPWCVFSFAIGNFKLGISLLVLYAVITVVRQFLEPKVIGSFIGLHPLVSIMSLFIGLAVLGVPGMFLVPILTIILKTMNENGTVKLYKSKKE